MVSSRMIRQNDLELFGFADTPEAAWLELIRRGLKVPTE
jgi:hypothetical protein